eukprot:g23283.t1
MARTEEVQRLTEHGCSVLCLGCPEGMLFGIDYSAWAVGPQFMGIKLIPPGLHYIYSGASAAEDELLRTENEEATRYADGVRSFDFDRNLGPYPLELREQWSELTRHATPELVQKIEPVGGRVRSRRAEYDATTNPKGVEDVSVEQPMALESQLFGIASRAAFGWVAVRHSVLNIQWLQQEFSGQELAVLGELQLAYIAFLLGQNFEGFEQWRALLQLLSRRLRAAQRAAEAAEAAEAPDSSGSEGQPEAEGAPRKPRRRAGVRVRRRREHAQKRREAAEQGLVAAEPLPPGLREAAEATEEVRDASSAHVKRPGLVEEQKERAAEMRAGPRPTQGPESFPQSELIGEKVLITGLVQAPPLSQTDVSTHADGATCPVASRAAMKVSQMVQMTVSPGPAA